MNTAARPKPIGWLGKPSLTQRVLEPNKVRISPDLSDLKSSYHSRTGRKNLHKNPHMGLKSIVSCRIPLEINPCFIPSPRIELPRLPLFVPAAIQFTCSNALRLKASNLETTWRLCCFGCSGCIKSSRNWPSFSPALRELWVVCGGGILVGYHVETLQHEKKRVKFLFLMDVTPPILIPQFWHISKYQALCHLNPFELSNRSRIRWASTDESQILLRELGRKPPAVHLPLPDNDQNDQNLQIHNHNQSHRFRGAGSRIVERAINYEQINKSNNWKLYKIALCCFRTQLTPPCLQGIFGGSLHRGRYTEPDAAKPRSSAPMPRHSAPRSSKTSSSCWVSPSRRVAYCCHSQLGSPSLAWYLKATMKATAVENHGKP